MWGGRRGGQGEGRRKAEGECRGRRGQGEIVEKEAEITRREMGREVGRERWGEREGTRRKGKRRRGNSERDGEKVEREVEGTGREREGGENREERKGEGNAAEERECFTWDIFSSGVVNIQYKFLHYPYFCF